MIKKRFTYEYDEYNGNLFDNEMNTFYHIEDSDENIKLLCDKLNWLVEENEQLKEQLREEQCRTTPITLTTHISDDDFKKIELMLKKHFGDFE